MMLFIFIFEMFLLVSILFVLKELSLGCAQVFLTVCTLVTLYFAKEVPLTPNQAQRLSDSAPLLDDPQQVVFDLSKSKTDMQLVENASGNKSQSDYEIEDKLKSENQKIEENQVESFNDSPGAVLVNLLTSLRHLPPAMHAVLVVMALTWVSVTFLYITNMIFYSLENSYSVFIFIFYIELLFYFIDVLINYFYLQLSWFPFFLFDTDWMGREVYHGDPKGEVFEVKAYDQGVREGAFGLLLNSVRTHN